MAFEREVLKSAISQLVGEIYNDDFDKFGLQIQVRLLPKFVEGSNLLSVFDWINAFRMSPAPNPPILNAPFYISKVLYKQSSDNKTNLGHFCLNFHVSVVTLTIERPPPYSNLLSIL